MSQFLSFFYNISIGEICHSNDTRTVNQIIEYSEEDLESDHSFIQWILPSPRKSQYNLTIPSISYDEIKSIRDDKRVIFYIDLFVNKILTYWGLNPWNINKIYLLSGHNGLRFSRLIESVILFQRVEFIPIIFHLINRICNSNLLHISYGIYKNQHLPLWKIRYLESLKIVNNDISE